MRNNENFSNFIFNIATIYHIMKNKGNCILCRANGRNCKILFSFFLTQLICHLRVTSKTRFFLKHQKKFCFQQKAASIKSAPDATQSDAITIFDPVIFSIKFMAANSAYVMPPITKQKMVRGLSGKNSRISPFLMPAIISLIVNLDC